MNQNKPGRSGSMITAFHVQPLRWRDLLTTFLPLLAVVLAPLIYGLYRTYYGYTNYGPASAAAWGRTWFYLAGVLVILLLLYTLRRLIRAHKRVEVYTKGLKLYRPGRKPLVIPWVDILGLTTSTTRHSFLGWKSKPRHTLTLFTRHHGFHQIDHRFKDVGDLTEIVQQQVYPLLYPQLKTAFHQGKAVPFGRIQLSREGLQVDHTELPWSYIQGLTARDGQLVVKLSPQKERRIPVQDIHNIDLFIKLIKEEV